MAKVFPAFYDPRKLVAELLSDREDVHTHHRRVVRVVRPERTRDDLPLTRPVATAFEQEVRDRELARRQPNSSFFDEERARCRMDTDGDFVVGVIEDQAPCERADVRSKPSVAQRDRLPQVGAGAPAVAGELLYRTPLQPTLAGNTVDSDIEMAQFARNSLDFQASLTFLQGKFRGLSAALKGE